MKKLLITIILVLAYVNNTHGQLPFSLKVEGGINYSDLRNWKYGDFKFGYYGGINTDVYIQKKLFLFSGISLINKGVKYRNSTIGSLPDYGYGYEDEDEDINNNSSKTYHVTMNPVYLQIPLHIGYRIQTTRLFSIMFSGGMYFAYGIGGKTKGYEDSIYNKENFSYNYFKYNNRLDIGVGSRIGVEYDKFGLNVGYDFGLTKVHKTADTKNHNLILTLSYKIMGI